MDRIDGQVVDKLNVFKWLGHGVERNILSCI